MKKNIEKGQNKKIHVKICNKCSKRCVMCKGSNASHQSILYAHNKCWNFDNCIVCGGGRVSSFFTNICDNYTNVHFKEFHCIICKKNFK